MPIFKYEARDTGGNFITSERTADSAESLSRQLLNEGFTPIHILLQPESAGANHLKKWSSYLTQRKHVSNAELALFTRQMYTLTKSGVTISIAIKHLSKATRSIRFSKALFDIAQNLESGQDLASSMRQYPDIFSPLMIAMVQVGQDTGQLENAFLRLTEYLELEDTTIRRLKTAIRYPIFVISAIIMGIIIINIFVIPTFAKVYVRTNIALPWMTVMLINVSNFFSYYWIHLLVLSLFIMVVVYRYLHTPEGKYQWDKYQLKIPVIGRLLKQIILLRFSETFAIVVNSGMPISDGLNLVVQSISNLYAREEINAMRDAIQRGVSIFQAAAACKLFGELELQMLAISEATGELGQMLEEISLYYQREVDYDLKHLIDMLEPMLLLGVAVMVLFLALAVYMPIWNMVKLVHKG